MTNEQRTSSTMSELKRKITETDPDYEDGTDQQAKRQRVLEQDGRDSACRKITSIIKREFQKEITDKEKELQQIDLRLHQARLSMDRLRGCVVASYYGRANRTLSSAPSTSNCSSSKVPPPNIHPTVKKYIGKAPRDCGGMESSSFPSQDNGSQSTDGNPARVTEGTGFVSGSTQPDPSSASTSTSFTNLRASKPASLPPKASTSATSVTSYDDRRARFKIKKKIVIGNVSRYIPVDQRESTDMSSHKWMVYVRGHKSEPDISGFVKKVWFFLHHSYKPNDHVEISWPPFHLTRRGWGEFPVRVQLHFVDSRNKKVDIIHHLKLDKAFTGLQKLGAETVVEVELERDFFESESEDLPLLAPVLGNGPQHLPSLSHKLSSVSSSSGKSSSSLPSSRSGSPTLQAATSSKLELFTSSSGKRNDSEILNSSSSSARRKRLGSHLGCEELEKVETRNEYLENCEMQHVAVKVNESSVDPLTRDKLVNVRNGAEKIETLNASSIKTEIEVVGDSDGGGGNCSVEGSSLAGSSLDKLGMVGYTEKADDHSMVGVVDEEFNVTIKHEELHSQLDNEVDVGMGEVEVGVGSWGDGLHESLQEGGDNDLVRDGIRVSGGIKQESVEVGLENIGVHSDEANVLDSIGVHNDDVNVLDSIGTDALAVAQPSWIVMPENVDVEFENIGEQSNSLNFVQSLDEYAVMNSSAVAPPTIIKNEGRESLSFVSVKKVDEGNALSGGKQPSGSSVSLLTSSMLDKLKQTQQQQQQRKIKISIVKPDSSVQQQKTSSLSSQSIPNQKQNLPAGFKQFTIVDIAKLQGNKKVPTAVSMLQSNNNVMTTNPQACVAKQTVSAANPQACVAKQSSHQSSQQNQQHPNQALTPKDSNLKHKIIRLLNKQQHIKSPSETMVVSSSVAAAPHRKVSLLQSNPQLVQVSSNTPSQKVVYLNPSTPSSQSSSSVSSSSSLLSSPQIIIPSSTQQQKPSVSLLPSPANKSKKKISLLTGLVVDAKNKNEQQEHVVYNNDTNQLPEMGASVVQNAHSHHQNQNVFLQTNNPPTSLYAKTVKAENVITIRKPLKSNSNSSHQHRPRIISPNINTISQTTPTPSTSMAQVIISKIKNSSSSNTNPPRSILVSRVATATTTTAVSSSTVSLLTPSTITSKTLHSNRLNNSNTILAETSTPNIVIAYPNSQKINASYVSSNISNCTESINAVHELKMSAIGKTKHRAKLQQLAVMHDSPEERIRKQYEVLNSYKQQLVEIKTAGMYHETRIYNDTIDGEVDDIPRLDIEDYPDMFSLAKAAIRLHPIVQPGVNKLTHPYCAKSRDQWFSWNVGKQRASEWHRACFTLKYIKGCLDGATAFKGQQLMTTKQLVHWCRLHAFSPQTPVHPKEPGEVKEERPETVNGDMSGFGVSLDQMPQSFSSLGDLNSQLYSLQQPESSLVDDADQVEILSEEFVKPKIEVKEEVMDEEEDSQSELLPLSEGAFFVHDWMRKRGVKLLANGNAEETVAADVLFRVMMEFGGDILRKSVAVHCQNEGSSSDSVVSVQDIHSALCSLPMATFCCNTFLGKEEGEEDSSGNTSR